MEKYTKKTEMAGGFRMVSAYWEKNPAQKLAKFYVNCIFLPLQTAAHPAILNSVILREKGGSSMMNWNWRDLDDVDDLIFTDASWKHSER